MGRKVITPPRAYVFLRKTKYTVGDETRISARWVASIRSADTARPLYLGRRNTKAEALEVCRVYLETGVKPVRQPSRWATIYTYETKSGPRYSVNGRLDGKQVHIGTAETRAEAERIRAEFKETGKLCARRRSPNGARKPRSPREPGEPKPAKTPKVRGPRVRLKDIKIEPGRNLRDHEIATLERLKPHLVAAAPAKPVTDRHRRPGESIQDWWRRLGAA